MKNLHPTDGYSIAASLLVAVAILLYIVLYLALNPIPANGDESPKHCGDFISYQAILNAFHSGNSGLDGDKDGIPCENRK